jgi:D-alanyl-D-alanine carboxypeptidase
MRFIPVIAAALFVLGCATPPAADQVASQPVVSTPAAEDPLAVKSREIVQAYADRNEFSGTVLVAKDGKPVYRQAFGFANRELDVAMKPEHLLRLGSITKQFTGAAILQLAEQGKLSVDDPVSKYYTAAPAAWSKITVQHLLNHRSGIPSYTGLPGFFQKQSTLARAPEEIVQLTQDMPLEFEPGAQFAYNNTGYVLLGYIIEKVSGQTYEAYLQQHIFTPLGLAHTGYDNSKALLPGRAAGYGFANGKWNNSDYISMTLPHAAGSLYANVDDLLIWQDALFSGKVVSPASFAAMTTDYGNGYGYGIGTGDFQGHRSIRHSGGIPGFSTYMARFPDDGMTFIVLGNLESAPSNRIANALARLWLNLPEPPPPPALAAVKVRPEVLDRYVGVYELMKDFNITITRDGGVLSAQATGQDAFTLTATSDTEFHFQAAGIRIVFPDGESPAQSLTLHQGGPRVAKRIPAN